MPSSTRLLLLRPVGVLLLPALAYAQDAHAAIHSSRGVQHKTPLISDDLIVGCIMIMFLLLFAFGKRCMCMCLRRCARARSRGDACALTCAQMHEHMTRTHRFSLSHQCAKFVCVSRFPAGKQ